MHDRQDLCPGVESRNPWWPIRLGYCALIGRKIPCKMSVLHGDNCRLRKNFQRTKVVTFRLPTQFLLARISLA